MLIKAGVDISRLRPEIRKKLTAIEKILRELSGTELVITSTFEGTHSAGSLHYANLAIDIRRPNRPDAVRSEIKVTLGNDYDIVLENSHIHIEYDPKPQTEEFYLAKS